MGLGGPFGGADLQHPVPEADDRPGDPAVAQQGADQARRQPRSGAADGGQGAGAGVEQPPAAQRQGVVVLLGAGARAGDLAAGRAVAVAGSPADAAAVVTGHARVLTPAAVGRGGLALAVLGAPGRRVARVVGVGVACGGDDRSGVQVRHPVQPPRRRHLGPAGCARLRLHPRTGARRPVQRVQPADLHVGELPHRYGAQPVDADQQRAGVGERDRPRSPRRVPGRRGSRCRPAGTAPAWTAGPGRRAPSPTPSRSPCSRTEVRRLPDEGASSQNHVQVGQVSDRYEAPCGRRCSRGGGHLGRSG